MAFSLKINVTRPCTSHPKGRGTCTHTCLIKYPNPASSLLLTLFASHVTREEETELQALSLQTRSCSCDSSAMNHVPLRLQLGCKHQQNATLSVASRFISDGRGVARQVLWL